MNRRGSGGNRGRPEERKVRIGLMEYALNLESSY